MMNRYLAFLVLLLPWLSPAAHVEFDYRNSALEAQGVRLINLYPVYVYDTNNILVTRDRITRPTLAAGTCTISNLLRGTYRAEFQGIYNVTTNWFQFPETNGTINAWLYRTNSAFGSVPTNGIFATLADLTNFIAASGVSSFNTRTGAVVLASNDVITALGYAPGTGAGTFSPWTNHVSAGGYSLSNAASVSAANFYGSGAGLTNITGNYVKGTVPLSAYASYSTMANALVDPINQEDVMLAIDASNVTLVSWATIYGRGDGLTNLNASALASGAVPLARLSGLTSNQLDAATWLLATNTTPGWKLTEPGYVGGTNTFEPVYTKTQGTNLFIRGNTNSAADGLYTVQTNWTDGEATAYLYTNANADVIWSREVDLDTTYTFTNAAGLANFTEGVISPTFQSPVTNTLSGGLCGTAAFGWTTNYTFGGFGVNGSTASDGAVLAFGQGLDYTTNGAVWTIYATNISEACLSSNVWWAATNGGSSSTIYATDIVWDGSEYNFNAASLTNIDLAEVLGLYAVYSLDVGAAAYFDGAAWFTNGLTSYGDVTLSGAGSDLTVDGNINLSTPVITGTNTWRGRQVIANSDGIGPQLLISNSTTAQNGLYVTNVGIATMSMKGGAGPEFSFKSYNAQVGPNWNWISNRAALVVSQGHGLTLCSSWANGSKQNIVLAPSGYETAEATMIVSNRWTLLNGDALVTNNLSVGNTLTVTNGLKYQGTNSTGNFTAVQGIQLYNVGGTAQTITLPDATNTPPWQIYRFSSTNPLAKVTLQTAQADQFIRQWGSNTFTMVGIGESGWYHDGKNWWPASKSKMVMPVAQFSCTTNIPLTAATTNYPVTFDSTDFNNSQGIALVGGSQMWITNAGQYEFAPSVVESFDGNDVVRFWFKKEGTNVANSCTPCKGQNGSIRVVTVPFIVNVTAPTYFEIWAESDSTGETLAAQAASGNFPAGPSVICPIKKISDSYP